LSRLKDLHVIAGETTRRYRGRPPRDIASELGVATVLEGTVRQDGDRIRIVARLADARTGKQLWSETFERDVQVTLDVQSELARRIAVALKGELTEPDEAALRAARTRDLEALRMYAKGRHYAELRTEDGLNRGLELFQAALSRDPNFAAARTGLAETYTALGTYGFLPRSEAFMRAAAEARRAIDTDKTLPEAHAVLGYALKNQFRWEEAESHIQRAIAMKPNWSTGHHWYSILLTQRGQFARAITESRDAISLEPQAIAPQLQLAAALLMARRYEDAIRQYERALQLEPTVASAFRSIGLARTYQGRFALAEAALDHAVRVTPAGAEDQETTAARGYLYARAGRVADARRIAQELRERHTAAGEDVAANLAAIYAGLGDRRQAFEWLRVAAIRHDPELGYAKVDPRWDPVRGEPDFGSLLNQLGLQ
jgi:tetratricopeptide (TPR) repeat protein